MSEKKLTDRLREAIRLRGYSIGTEKAYVSWCERYVRFHKLHHPSTIGEAEVEQFLSHLASHEKVAASTQGQALSALLFLYEEVLKIPLGDTHSREYCPIGLWFTCAAGCAWYNPPTSSRSK